MKEAWQGQGLVEHKYDSAPEPWRPLGIPFRPFTNSVSDTKYHERCAVVAPQMGHNKPSYNHCICKYIYEMLIFPPCSDKLTGPDCRYKDQNTGNLYYWQWPPIQRHSSDVLLWCVVPTTLVSGDHDKRVDCFNLRGKKWDLRNKPPQNRKLQDRPCAPSTWKNDYDLPPFWACQWCLTFSALGVVLAQLLVLAQLRVLGILYYGSSPFFMLGHSREMNSI
jgi:hypothetical protein